MDLNRFQEVLQVQDALRKSEEAQEAVSTLMDGQLFWSLNSTISGVIFRVAATYRMLMEATGPSVLGCNPEWAIDEIKRVSQTTAFNVCSHELPVTIHLIDLPEAICDAFGSLISITLFATENKKLKLRISEMLGVLEESEWLDAERESHALWHDCEKLITELDIDHQRNKQNRLHRLIIKEGKNISRQEKLLDAENEERRCATQQLEEVQNETFMFERKQVQFKKSQSEVLEERLAIQKLLQDIRKAEYCQLEPRYMESMKCIKMQQALCIRQGVMDDNGNFKQPTKGSGSPANLE